MDCAGNTVALSKVVFDVASFTPNALVHAILASLMIVMEKPGRANSDRSWGIRFSISAIESSHREPGFGSTEACLPDEHPSSGKKGPTQKLSSPGAFHGRQRRILAGVARDNRGVKRSGFADTPLHGGFVPPWLADRMTSLGTAITESILLHYGHAEFLSRLSDPFWFQAFGSVMGMDWHSSGVTTSVLAALKRGLNPRSSELGLYVCGGRGKQSRKTPDELRMVAERGGLDGDELARTSRLTAKIDNNCIADGFQIYLHSFIVAAGGEWAVVQQGMNQATGFARRYHWHSAKVRDFVDEPHTASWASRWGNLEPCRCERSARTRRTRDHRARKSRDYAGPGSTFEDAPPSRCA
jgi:hypothetical protein